MKDKYILPTYEDYSFGSWLKNNVGNLAQTIGGVALMATGAGAAAGLPLIASGIGGFGASAAQSSAEKQAEEDQAILQETANKNTLAQNRLQGLTNSINIPTFKEGGKLPQGNATLNEAKEYVKMFPEEMAMGELVEYEHTKNKKLAQRIAADHIKDYLKMSGTPGYYTALKEAGISDELNKMESGGYFEYKNGGIYINPEKRGSFTAWAKKHGMSVQQAASKVMANKEKYSSSVVKKANFAKNASKWKHALGGKLDNIPDLSFFPDGGKVEPVYPISYGNTRSFSGSNYIFDPNTQADNNYFYPENVISRGSTIAQTPNVLPTMVGAAPGFVTYSERTDLPPAGYRNVMGNDTTYTYRKEFKTPTGRDTVAYKPGTRIDVANAMHRLNNPTGRDVTNPTLGVPSAQWHTADKSVSAYYDAIGKPRPNMFAEGGEIKNKRQYINEEPLPELIDLRPQYKTKAGKIFNEFMFGDGTTQGEPILPLVSGINTIRLMNPAYKSLKMLRQDPNMYYRGIGKAGAKDAISSGVLRANPNPAKAIYETSSGKSINMTKKFNKTYYSPNLNTAKTYGDGYIAEVPKTSAEFYPRYSRSNWSMLTNEQIPLSKGQIYKKGIFGYYPMQYANGGDLQRIEGPTHEQGGVQLMPGVEVEGGEYRFTDPEGGKMNNILTEYKGGGTHEENAYGGIPVGGKARVEEGEYRFTDPETGESYIFSDRF